MQWTMTLPAFVTFVAFLIAFMKAPGGGTYGAGHLIGAGYLMLATIASLAAWLIWALVA